MTSRSGLLIRRFEKLTADDGLCSFFFRGGRGIGTMEMVWQGLVMGLSLIRTYKFDMKKFE